MSGGIFARWPLEACSFAHFAVRAVLEPWCVPALRLQNTLTQTPRKCRNPSSGRRQLCGRGFLQGGDDTWLNSPTSLPYRSMATTLETKHETPFFVGNGPANGRPSGSARMDRGQDAISPRTLRFGFFPGASGEPAGLRCHKGGETVDDIPGTGFDFQPDGQ